MALPLPETRSPAMDMADRLLRRMNRLAQEARIAEGKGEWDRAKVLYAQAEGTALAIEFFSGDQLHA